MRPAAAEMIASIRKKSLFAQARPEGADGRSGRLALPEYWQWEWELRSSWFGGSLMNQRYHIAGEAFPIGAGRCTILPKAAGYGQWDKGRTMKTRRSIVACTLVALLALFAAGEARAQDAYPNRVIRVVVGFAAGGGNDIFARLVMNKFQEAYRRLQSSSRTSRAPAGEISSEYVSHQPPDGYTVLVAATGQMSICAAIYPKLRLSSDQEFYSAQYDRLVPAGAGGAGEPCRSRT